MNQLSQRTLVRMMEVMERMHRAAAPPPPRLRPRGTYTVAGASEAQFWSRLLYEKDFKDWFVTHSESFYTYNWDSILRDLRSTRFFFPQVSYSGGNILGREYLSEQDAQQLGEATLCRLAALLATRQEGESVRRSLELDGFDVNAEKLTLVPLEGPISQQEEEDRFTQLVRGVGLPSESIILKHLKDAGNLYSQGNDHPSLGEARSFLQAVIDDIAIETDRLGAHATKLPAGTKNRIAYLQEVGFFTTDEQASFGSAWGALSAGAHPGLTAREEARIGLVLAVEFGQVLLLKVKSWKVNQFKRFSNP